MSLAVAEDVGQVLRVSDPPAASFSPRPDGWECYFEPVGGWRIKNPCYVATVLSQQS